MDHARNRLDVCVRACMHARVYHNNFARRSCKPKPSAQDGLFLCDVESFVKVGVALQTSPIGQRECIATIGRHNVRENLSELSGFGSLYSFQ